MPRIEERDCPAGYDVWAGSYDDEVNPMVASVEHALDRHPPVWTGAAVLEIGCGTGRNLARALDRGAARVVGVDVSAGMLAVAERKLAGAPVTLHLADARRRLPLPDGALDGALISLVLEHLDGPDLVAVIAEVGRLLAPGGWLRICEIHPQLRGDGIAAHFQDVGSDTEIHLPSFRHDHAELLDAMRAPGLQPTSTTDWYAAGALIERCPKLGKHRGKAVLLDVSATAGVGS